MKKVLVPGCVGSVKEKEIISCETSPLKLSSASNAVKYSEGSDHFIVEDGVVGHVFMEEVGAFEVSDAGTVLAALTA